MNKKLLVLGALCAGHAGQMLANAAGDLIVLSAALMNISDALPKGPFGPDTTADIDRIMASEREKRSTETDRAFTRLVKNDVPAFELIPQEIFKRAHKAWQYSMKVNRVDAVRDAAQSALDNPAESGLSQTDLGKVRAALAAAPARSPKPEQGWPYGRKTPFGGSGLYKPVAQPISPILSGAPMAEEEAPPVQPPAHREIFG